ncbi:MAG TPA: hypothetical protein VIF60_23245 [Burkholderiaceae bacterium]|jgi:hypothetical protein
MISYDDQGIPDISKLDFSETDEQRFSVETVPLDSEDFALPDLWCVHPGQLQTGNFDPAIFDTLRNDPKLAPQLEILRAYACQQFSSLIDQTVAVLPKESLHHAAVNCDGGAVLGRRLKTGSRKVEFAVKSRREQIEAFALECVLNLGKPDWNPFDPSTSSASPSSLLALLR